MRFDLAHTRACAGSLGERPQGVAPGEGRGLARQPVRARELGRDPLMRDAGARRPGTPDDCSHLVAAETVLGRSSAPFLAQPIEWHRVSLSATRLERRNLCGPSGALAALLHVLEDFGASPREVSSATGLSRSRAPAPTRRAFR